MGTPYVPLDHSLVHLLSSSTSMCFIIMLPSLGPSFGGLHHVLGKVPVSIVNI